MSSRSTDIDVGDLVRITEGKNDGQRGTVRYVGNLDGQEGLFVGVELKERKGRHNGTVRGQQYFVCPDGYGYMGRSHMFKVVVKARRNTPARPKSRTQNRSRTSSISPTRASPAATPETNGVRDGTDDMDFDPAMETKADVPVENGQVESSSGVPSRPIPQPIRIPRKSSPRTSPGSSTKASPSPMSNGSNKPKNKTGKGNRTTATAVLTKRSGRVSEIPTKSRPARSRRTSAGSSRPSPPSSQTRRRSDGGKERSRNLVPPATPVPKITTTADKNIQTDNISVAEFSQTVANTQRLEIQAVRESLNASQARVYERDLIIVELQEKMGSLEETVEMLVIEKADLEEELMSSRDRVEEWEIKCEHLQLDLEELMDDRSNIRQNLIQSLDADAHETAEVMDINSDLQRSIRMMQEVLADKLHRKSVVIENLHKRLEHVSVLEAKVLELQEKEQRLNRMVMENEELQMELDIRADVESIIQHLTDKNLSLEAHIDEIRDELQHMAQLNEIQASVNEETEAYVEELQMELDARVGECFENEAEREKVRREMSNLQRQMHKFRNHVRELEQSKNRMLTMNAGMSASRHEERVRAEALLHENVQLRGAISNIRATVIDHGRRVAESFADQIRVTLVRHHFPHTIPVDFDTIEFLAQLERLKRQAIFCRQTLDKFYVDSLTLSGTGGATVDTEMCEKAHGMCPILVRHERWLEAMQRRLLMLYLDAFDQVVKFSAQFESIEPVYDRLLDACAKDNLHTFAARELTNVTDVYRTFLRRYCSSMNIEEEVDVCDKWVLRQGALDVLYTMKTFSARFGHANDIIHGLLDGTRGRSNSGRPRIDSAASDGALSSAFVSNSANYPRFSSFDDEKSDGTDVLIQEQKRVLLVGVLEKIHSLTESIFEMFDDILEFAMPSSMSYSGKSSLLGVLSLRNVTSCSWEKISTCIGMSRLSVIKIGSLRNELESVSRTETFDIRLSHINGILDRHSEVNDDGLVVSMEHLFESVKDVQLVCNVDQQREKEMSKYDEVSEKTKNQAKPVWFIKAETVRGKLEGAEQVYEDLQSAKGEIQTAKKDMWYVQKKDQETQAMNSILVKEIGKLKAQHDDFARLERLLNESTAKMDRYRTERDSLRDRLSVTEKETSNLSRDLEMHKQNLKELRQKRHDEEDNGMSGVSKTSPMNLRRTSPNTLGYNMRARSAVAMSLSPSVKGVVGRGSVDNSVTSTTEIQYRNAVEEHQEQIGILSSTVNTLRSQLCRIRMRVQCEQSHECFLKGLPNEKLTLYRSSTKFDRSFVEKDLETDLESESKEMKIDDEDQDQDEDDGSETDFSRDSFDPSEEEFLNDILDGDLGFENHLGLSRHSNGAVRLAEENLRILSRRIGHMRATPRVVDLVNSETNIGRMDFGRQRFYARQRMFAKLCDQFSSAKQTVTEATAVEKDKEQQQRSLRMVKKVKMGEIEFGRIRGDSFHSRDVCLSVRHLTDIQNVLFPC